MARLKSLVSLAAAIGLLLAGVGAVAPANASPTREPDRSLVRSSPVPKLADGQAQVWNPDVQRQVTVSRAAADEILRDYWTPERLEKALPISRSADKRRAQPGAAVLRPGKEETLTDPAPATVVGTLSASHFSYTNGKVFFRNPINGGNYSCSGGAVNSGSRRLVVTAGHCVHPGNGGNQWMQNWIFIPGYHRGSEPRGRFAAYRYFSSTGWTRNSNHRRDFAFVATYTNSSGQRLVNAVGGHGLIVNPGRPYVHIAGYPGNRDNGQVQWNCWGTTVRWSASDPGQKLRCGWREGSSGGPWLRDFGASGVGYVISNVHGYATDGSGDNYGPYYDNHTGDVYAAARNVAP